MPVFVSSTYRDVSRAFSYSDSYTISVAVPDLTVAFSSALSSANLPLVLVVPSHDVGRAVYVT